MKTILNIICAFFLVNTAFAQERLIPQTANLKTVISTGKTNSTYYNLLKSKPVKVTVSGPGELVIYTRTVVDKSDKKTRPFILKYKVDGKRIKTKKVPKKQKSLRSRVKNNSDKVVSKAHKVKIKVPNGKHTYSFYRQTSKQQAVSRFVFIKKSKVVWNEVKLDGLKPVILKDLNNSKTVTYSEIGNGKTVQFKTSNTTGKIRLFFRANFSYKMLEDCVNKLQITIDGKPTAFRIASKKSSRLENLTNAKLIPGALEKIYIDIPLNGKHTIKISLKDETKTSGLIRVFTSSVNLLKRNSYEKVAFSY